MAVLVTGASGLVGHAMMQVLREDNEIIGVGRRRLNEPGYYACDLEKDSLDDVAKGRDISHVIHAAALIPSSSHSSIECKITNEFLDEKVFGFAERHHAGVLYISGAFYNADGSPKDELSEVVVSDPYHAGKVNSENRLLSCGMTSCVFRIPSPYGERQTNNNVLKTFIDKAMKGDPIGYYGTGKRTQNFVHVDDIARAALLSLRLDAAGVFNIASAKSTSMKNLALTVKKVVDDICSSDVVVEGAPVADSQESNRVNIDISKAWEKLGWQPRIDIEMGVRSLIKARLE